jgi:outer membrane murein-binding lipoprotein Lpp
MQRPAPGEDSDVTHRTSDNGQSYRIVREVPAWGVVTLILTVAVFGGGQAIALFYGQREQGAQIERLSARVVELTAQVARLAEEVASKNIADVRHDMLIDDLRRRIVEVEARTLPPNGNGPTFRK